ncbi:MAG: isoprenylcysteine carboxylmethyltransferase family protein [Spirochaetales bacterium]|nr:isoprenylcysteine carboxylmethyltransferase family protein [Spirochaetales bacterium]
MTGDKKSKRREIIGAISLLIEKYLFSLSAFFLAFSNIRHIILNWTRITDFFRSLPSLGINQATFISQMVVTFILALVNAFVGFLLLLKKKPLQNPKGFLEIFIPLVSTYFWIAYNVIRYIPNEVNLYLVPLNTLLVFAFIGSIIALVGCVISALAVFHLRRSFSVLIQVRDIVKHGLYRYSRHPIYFGYIISAVGLTLTSPQLFFLIFSLIHIGLFVFRAYLEEKKLAAFSQEYQDYMHNTPFIIPVRLRKIDS